MTEAEEFAALEVAAEAKAREINRRAGQLLQHELPQRAARVIQGQAPLARKYIMLKKITDEAMTHIAPLTPCEKGCSDCCYQAVPIPEHEARMLAEFTGRALNPAARQPNTLEHILDLQLNQPQRLLQNPTPCPFLVDNKCSVYAVRPVQCRSHHVLHSDSSRCNLFRARDLGRPMPQVKFDISWADELAAVLLMQGDDPVADIRAWFPS